MGPRKPLFGSLSFRLFLCLSAFCLVPMLLFFSRANKGVERSVLSERGAGLYALSVSRAEAVSSYFADRIKTAEMFSRLPCVSAFLDAKTDRVQFAEEFSRFFGKSDFKDCFVFSKDGALMYSAKFASGIKSVTDEVLDGTQILETYRRVVESGKTAISPLSTNPLDGNPSVFIASAVSVDDSFAGVCVFSADLSKVMSMMASDSPSSGSFVCAYAKNIPYVLSAAGESLELVPREPLVLKDGTPFANNELSGPVDGILADSAKGEPIVIAWEYIPMLRWYVFSSDNILNSTGFLLKYERELFIFSILLLPFCIFFANMVSRTALSPVKRLIARSEKMLCGDFSDTAPVRASMEFKILADNFAAIRNMTVSFMERSSDKTREVSENLSDMLTRTKERERMLGMASESVESIRGRASGISGISSALKESLSAVLAASEETVVNAEGGLVHIEKIEASMKDLNSFSAELTGQLRALYGSAEVIERVVETMENVADKTNLLSLNAAIESKKAGDYGKGFSVVAAEIGALATQTANSTVEIEKGISAMMASVNAGIEGMNAFAKKVESSYADMMVVSSHLTGIIQRVQGLPMRLDSALESLSEQDASSAEICSAMEALKKDIAKILDSVLKTESMAAETLAKVQKKDGSGIV